jgi:hypothetical protein
MSKQYYIASSALHQTKSRMGARMDQMSSYLTLVALDAKAWNVQENCCRQTAKGLRRNRGVYLAAVLILEESISAAYYVMLLTKLQAMMNKNPRNVKKTELKHYHGQENNPILLFQ